MAKTDRMRQHALQEELARQSAKAAAAERERAELEARVRQLQVCWGQDETVSGCVVCGVCTRGD